MKNPFHRKCKKPVVEMKEYKSAHEIAKALDREIVLTKNVLRKHLRQLGEIQTLAKRSKKARDAVFKLVGKKTAKNALGETSVGDLKVVLKPTSFHEFTAIEEAARSQEKKLQGLQKAREAVKLTRKIVKTRGLRYIVLKSDGVPTRILMRTP